jgi:hypothetical protein
MNHHVGPSVSPIPGATPTRPPHTIPTAADDTIVRAEASEPARVGRIDRRIGKPPCARLCRRTDARNATLGSDESHSSDGG